jgi:hypothetical protein
MARTISAFAGMALIAPALMLLGGHATADEFTAKFSGFEEVGALNAETGAILSTGNAALDLNLDRAARTLTYKLTYSGFGDTVTQSHIHFGKRHVPGGIMVFLCTNLGNGSPGTPACPNPTGGGTATVTGMIAPADVRAIPGQNVTAGDFNALQDSLDSDTAYGNIHTNRFPAGEIRGQVRRIDDDDHQGH